MVWCSATGCKWRSEHGKCLARKQRFEEHYVLTKYAGQQAYLKCKTFEEDKGYNRELSVWEYIRRVILEE